MDSTPRDGSFAVRYGGMIEASGTLKPMDASNVEGRSGRARELFGQTSEGRCFRNCCVANLSAWLIWPGVIFVDR